MAEDPWDDWETAADAGLNHIKPTTIAKTKEANQKIWEKANQHETPVIIHSNDTFAHTEYKPPVKVLKRPQEANTRNKQTTNTPVKTLEEKERAYMEAKRRISEEFGTK